MPFAQTFTVFGAADDQSVLDCLQFFLANFEHGGDISPLWDKFKCLLMTLY